MLVDFNVRAQREMDFFIGGSIIMDFGQKLHFEVKNVWIIFLFITNMQIWC